MYFHAGLIIGRCAEYLALRGRDSGIPRNKRCSYSAQRLNAQSEGCDIKQENISHLSLEHASLDSCAQCHHLVRINALNRFFAKKLTYHILDLWHSRLPTDQNHIGYLSC